MQLTVDKVRWGDTAGVLPEGNRSRGGTGNNPGENKPRRDATAQLQRVHARQRYQVRIIHSVHDYYFCGHHFERPFPVADPGGGQGGHGPPPLACKKYMATMRGSLYFMFLGPPSPKFLDPLLIPYSSDTILVADTERDGTRNTTYKSPRSHFLDYFTH